MEEQENIFEEEGSTDIIAVILRMLKYWYFIAASILIAAIIAYFYTKFTTSVFEVSTTLMVKEEASSASTEKVLEEMDLFSRKKNIQNEIVILQSYSTIQETIKKLNFAVSYYSDDGYSLTELYNSCPFEVVYDSSSAQPVYLPFRLEPINNEQFKLISQADRASLYTYQTDINTGLITDFKINGIYKYGEPIITKACNFTITKRYNGAIPYLPDLKYQFNFNTLSNLTLAYKNAVQISVLQKGVDILNLSLQGNNVNKITDFLNHLTTVYIQRDLAKKNSMANNTIAFIDNQLADITDSLNYSENRLKNFRSSNKIMDIDYLSQQLFEKLADLQTEKAGLITNREYYAYLMKTISKNEGINDLMIPSTMGINDASLNKLVMELVDLNTERLTLMANSTEKSYVTKNIENKISNIKSLILNSLQNITDANHVSILNIDNKIDALNKEVVKLPEKQQRLFGFEREFKLNDAIYTFLLQKRAEAQIAKASNLPDSEVIDAARNDVYVKKSTKYRQIYLIALVLGLLIPVVLIYLDYILKDQVQLRKDLERITKIPIVGGIIQYRKPITRVFIEHPKSIIAESFRTFYTNLQFFTKGKQNQVILVTSSMPREGKTFNSINLASVFASFNKKTCLLSFDLRLAKVHRAFNISNDIGLSTYLINHSAIDEIIFQTDIGMLDIIPAGPPPPNPVELISSKKTEELFEYLKSVYDCVIIDSPPVGVVADGLLLAKYSDVNVIVARQSYTRKKALGAVVKELKANNIENLTILFNASNSFFSSCLCCPFFKPWYVIPANIFLSS
ncbi:MAG: polysaccharide biosynthesis tyrosine autokinase, partial [Bacteroidales bacterium]|nr:polysaccharide biosynthesis tyrosine autokinase [Bacteroidales bacterium]